MAKTFKLKVITPEKMFYSDNAEMVIVRTTGGDEGFMANHIWGCKLLVPGEMKIKEPGKGKNEYKIAALSDGFINIKDSVTIYTDAAEWPDEIDVGRAERAKERAEEKLKHKQSSFDQTQTEIALHKAINRIKVKSDVYDIKK
ncbi:MAG: ATP synthase F1 subunit epsilon [Eubacteriaceae bacterium]|nr:ATP synthase F1 subunit epsilon [Eubacteriaceae bacterium]